MFSRIREAARIIAYREPEIGPDAVIIARAKGTPSPSGMRVARFIEALVAIYGIGWFAAFLSDRLFKAIPSKHFSSATVLAASLAVFLLMLLHWIRADLEQKFRTHLHLADTLAPYFGKRLDTASRVLRGTARAS